MRILLNGILINLEMNKLKAIVLAGGNGSRLFPLTIGTSKQLLPVYDKPMIYYPISTLILSGIKDICVITKPSDSSRFKDLLGDGTQYGVNFSFITQTSPNGIAEAFILAESFIGDSNVVLILGDNIFYGNKFSQKLNKAIENFNNGSSSIFTIKVNTPNQFGVIKFNDKNKLEKVVEKPDKFISNNIVLGLYFYTNDVVQIAKTLRPSKRNELEITEINNSYLKKEKLELIFLDNDDDFFWSDTGTYKSLIEASKFIESIEKNTGKKVGCIEEISYSMGYINQSQLKLLASKMKNSDYGKYIFNL